MLQIFFMNALGSACWCLININGLSWRGFRDIIKSIRVFEISKKIGFLFVSLVRIKFVLIKTYPWVDVENRLSDGKGPTDGISFIGKSGRLSFSLMKFSSSLSRISPVSGALDFLKKYEKKTVIDKKIKIWRGLNLRKFEGAKFYIFITIAFEMITLTATWL